MVTQTERYCARQAYQLCLMRGLYACTIAGKHCKVDMVDRVVLVEGNSVPIAKSWANL